MTDELSSDSGFEFVEKKSEEFESNPSFSTAASSNTDAIYSSTASNTMMTSVTSPTAGGSILSNIAPPRALPSFISNLVPAEDKQAKEIVQNDKSLPKNQIPEKNVQNPQSDKGPQILIAPDSPIRDSVVSAGNLFNWVKDTVANSNVLSKVAEKAKSSVNSMITTLDPQMREFIYSGGDIEIIVLSEKEDKVAPIREAFQNIFGNATVTGINVETTFEAAQPVGFSSGVKAAHERIICARKNSLVTADIPLISIENFLLEVAQDKWFDLGVILLDDPKQNINLQIFTQMTPVPSQIVETAQESTPENYSKDGFSVTVGNLMGVNLQVSHTEWHHALTGVSRKELIFLAAQSLAGIYKNTINPI
ncbi:protein PRRC1-A-like isoform X1 [Trichogramma pretiosum]|uniref:protein PRRC1-A-like isoform X1 n=1 Tax=Trichogramma pretiosum TaxID=7493 RepID=UPI0006C98602|nr:protein PRRC1-A-like isoform X1 [Trichogramma pretiosum]XP_023316858.1 protein PRRC1-A-like isoform X1 [Trichogramma pretiosum]